ncbi:hypothetical protein CSA37_07770 [Candidatus Fermentibacteria bacterium]|nr:MAG: hypothetical protein CSA37_07770 [Candidatus Fermentibacteria bacterium]
MVTMEAQPVQIIATYPSRVEAMKVGRRAVELHMAACAQITSQITSIYHWEGSIQTGKEFQLKLKTISKKEQQLVTWLSEHHPYKVAEILVVPLTYVSPDYLRWMKEVTHH